MYSSKNSQQTCYKQFIKSQQYIKLQNSQKEGTEKLLSISISCPLTSMLTMQNSTAATHSEHSTDCTLLKKHRTHILLAYILTVLANTTSWFITWYALKLLGDCSYKRALNTSLQQQCNVCSEKQPSKSDRKLCYHSIFRVQSSTIMQKHC